MKKKILFVGMLLSCVGVAHARSHRIDYDLEKMVMLGSGCGKNAELEEGRRHSEIMVNGNDIAFVSSRLVLALGLDSSGVLADRKNCVVRIPSRVQNGFYVSAVHERLSYGIIKSPGARASISALFDSGNFLAREPLTVEMKAGEFQDDFDAAKIRTVRFPEPSEGRCRNQNGITKLNIAASAQLESEHDFLLLSSGDGDIRYNASLAFARCE